MNFIVSGIRMWFLHFYSFWSRVSQLVGHGQQVGHWRFCGGPQSYTKHWLRGSKKFYFSYIFWRIDKNRGLRCADLFSEIRPKIALPEEKKIFEIRAITEDTKLTRKWRNFVFEAEGDSYGPTAVVHRAMVHANFQETQNGPGFRKG